MELIKPEFGLIFWTIVTFVVLLLVLRKLAWKPILTMLDERETAIKGSLEQAEKAKTEAEATLKENKKVLGEARRKVSDMLEDGKKASENLKAEIVEKAEKEAREIVERGKREIENEKNAAISELKAASVELALAAAEKLIQTSLKDKGHKKLVVDYIERLDQAKEQ
jgi:F-type H+-transporting ATPase subunit b